MLIKYIRTPKKEVPTLKGGQIVIKHIGNDPIGIIVAIDKCFVGWSLCNPSDKFDKDLGKSIAINRALHYGDNLDPVLTGCPNRIKQDIKDMYERSKLYFK